MCGNPLDDEEDKAVVIPTRYCVFWRGLSNRLGFICGNPLEDEKDKIVMVPN